MIIDFVFASWNRFTMVLGGAGFDVSFDVGWFHGEPPALLHVCALEMQDCYPRGFSGIIVFRVQFLKFLVELGLDWRRPRGVRKEYK